MSAKWHSNISNVCSNNTIVEFGQTLVGIFKGEIETPKTIKAYRDMRDYAKYLQQCLPAYVDFYVDDNKREITIHSITKDFKDGLKSLDSLAYELTFKRGV